MPCHRGHMGKHQGQLGGMGRGNNCRQEHLLWFPRERINEAGQTGLGLASLNNLSGLWGICVVPSCLVPGHGVIGCWIVVQSVIAP